jgi:hypothetical protein
MRYEGVAVRRGLATIRQLYDLCPAQREAPNTRKRGAHEIGALLETVVFNVRLNSAQNLDSRGRNL